MDVPDLSRLSLNGRSGEAPAFVRDDLYEERHTGEAGIAIFATAFIPSGTRLFCEEALIVIHNEANQTEVFQTVTSLSEKEQRLYWELAASLKPSKDVAWIDGLRQWCEGKEESFNSLVEAHEKAWSIYETNRFNMYFPDSDYKLGVFTKCARLNHSCAPNVFHRYNHRIGRMTIHALRDIKPGEELNTSYIDICHPTAARRQILKKWGFNCQCSACNSPDSSGDFLRKRTEDMLTKIRKYEKQQESRVDQSEETDDVKIMGFIEKGMQLMEKQGMEETDTLGYLLSLAIKHGLRLGRVAEAAQWAERLVVVEKKCLGEDSDEYDAAEELCSAFSQVS
ncbi:set domain-containing protein 5 [Seiridium cupressi]